MNAEALLGRLQGVRSRGPGRWGALCPSHEDRTPSLSIREGRRGLLVHCFSGCTVDVVCQALDLRVSDLFHDAPLPRSARPHFSRPRIDRRRLAFELELHGIGLQDPAHAVLYSASGMDCRDWSDADFDAAVNAVAKAYHDHDRAQLLFDVADNLRARAHEESSR